MCEDLAWIQQMPALMVNSNCLEVQQVQQILHLSDFQDLWNCTISYPIKHEMKLRL